MRVLTASSQERGRGGSCVKNARTMLKQKERFDMHYVAASINEAFRAGSSEIIRYE